MHYSHCIETGHLELVIFLFQFQPSFPAYFTATREQFKHKLVQASKYFEVDSRQTLNSSEFKLPCLCIVDLQILMIDVCWPPFFLSNSMPNILKSMLILRPHFLLTLVMRVMELGYYNFQP